MLSRLLSEVNTAEGNVAYLIWSYWTLFSFVVYKRYIIHDTNIHIDLMNVKNINKW